MTELSDSQARQWLCTHLGSLRGRAREGGWEPKLDRAVAAVTAGRSAAAVCRGLGYTGTPETLRGPFDAGIPLSRLGIDPAPVRGEYVCPEGRCGRRDDADADGREPRCALYGRVMDLRPAGEALS